jgi:Domain of unknown function (DUF6460)
VRPAAAGIDGPNRFSLILLDMTMTKTIGTVLKLLAASLVVGLVLTWLNIRPQEVYREAGDAARGAVGQATAALGWAWDFILIGAAVVVPVWLVFFVLRYLRGRG